MRILSIHLFSYLKLYYYNEFLTIELNEQKLQNKIREASRSETSPLFFLISLSALNLKRTCTKLIWINWISHKNSFWVIYNQINGNPTVINYQFLTFAKFYQEKKRRLFDRWFWWSVSMCLLRVFEVRHGQAFFTFGDIKRVNFYYHFLPIYYN